MSSLESVFVAGEDIVQLLLERKRIPLGEVLGKHSDVDATVTELTMRPISDDVNIVAFFEKELGGCVGPNIVDRMIELDADGYWRKK